jgi:hydrogenase expression/formation protein HypC
MCLGVPGLVVAVEGNVAVVDFWGVRKTVLLDIVDAPVAPGDYVLNHVGFAIRRIPADEAQATLDLFDEILAASPGDLMADDVRAELVASPDRPR